MRITKITKLQPGVYAHVCPLCEEIHASASDIDMMPEFSICECDRNGNKQLAYELFDRDGNTWIRRNKYPRFVARVSFCAMSDIEDIEWLDDCTDVLIVAKVMRKASEFLTKISNKT